MKANIKGLYNKMNIGISDENLNAVARELSIILADEYVLYTKTRNAHWNVEGGDFYDKHKFFEAQFEQLNEMIDQVAERIRMLDIYTPSSLSHFLAVSNLSEEQMYRYDSQAFISVLLADHELVIRNIREKIVLIADTYKDLGTSDFITGILGQHEKIAWMLRAHLK